MIDVKRRAFAGVVLAGALLVAGCNSGGGTGSGGDATSPTDPANLTGEITVLTNRTDLVTDGSMDKYAAEFKKVYPKVTVKFQGITDYEGEVKIRMNSDEYGDVLLIPQVVAKADYPKFFAPLGEQAELSKTYSFTDYGSVAGKVYGIASFGAANGFVYNKDVWKQAGVTSWPTTPEQFLDSLRKIKATGATPYYTNYKDGWPLSSWSNVVGSVTCDAKANDKLATTEPWAAGTDLTVGDSLLFNIVKEKLAEADPTTTNWEDSKGQIATGKVGTMWLGSWAVSQMQDAAKKAGKDPSSIGYMPFPAQSGGKFCSVVSPDKALRDQHPLQEQARRPRLGRLGAAQVRLRRDRAGRLLRQGRGGTGRAHRLHRGRRQLRRAVPGRRGEGDRDRQRLRGRAHQGRLPPEDDRHRAGRGEGRPARLPRRAQQEVDGRGQDRRLTDRRAPGRPGPGARTPTT